MERTGCKKPCRFNKYFKVHKLVKKLVGNKRSIKIKFENVMIVRNETLMVSTRNLIADMGGAMGLFLGFSFMMIVDWFEFFFDSMFNKLIRK